MSRRSRFSMINPTDGPRVGAWRRAALGFCLAAALSATGVTAAQAATLEGQQFDDTVVLGQHKLQLNGLGLRGVAWLKAFVAGLYVTTPSRDAAALLAETGPRRLRLMNRVAGGSFVAAGLALSSASRQ